MIPTFSFQGRGSAASPVTHSRITEKWRDYSHTRVAAGKLFFVTFRGVRSAFACALWAARCVQPSVQSERDANAQHPHEVGFELIAVEILRDRDLDRQLGDPGQGRDLEAWR